MKVYLDDAREAYQGWVRTYTPDEVIHLLKSGQVEQLSLDHDLGGDDEIGTGYTVLQWIENEVALNGFVPPPVIKVHSANPSVHTKMQQAIESIMRLAGKNLASRKGTALRVYLDDSRETPEGWVRTYTSSETIEILKGGHVTELSLDHHLGNDADDNGFEVLRWLEEEVRRRGFKPPDRIEIHTSDSEARVEMESAVKRIHDLWRRQQG